MTDADKAWHASFKPNFTTRNQLVCKSSKLPTSSEWSADVLARSDTKLISLNTLKATNQKLNISELMANASIELLGDVPKD